MSGGVGVVVFLYIVGTIITWVLCTAYIADQDSMYRRQYSDWIMYVLVGLCAGLFWPVVVIGVSSDWSQTIFYSHTHLCV
jgi:hypothetical protein